MSSPQYGFDVVVSLDGEEWCALIGPNLQDGIAGFGVVFAGTVATAARSWARGWGFDSPRRFTGPGSGGTGAATNWP